MQLNHTQRQLSLFEFVWLCVTEFGMIYWSVSMASIHWFDVITAGTFENDQWLFSFHKQVLLR